MEVLSYEQQAHDAGYALVCGVDEAGARRIPDIGEDTAYDF